MALPLRRPGATPAVVKPQVEAVEVAAEHYEEVDTETTDEQHEEVAAETPVAVAVAVAKKPQLKKPKKATTTTEASTPKSYPIIGRQPRAAVKEARVFAEGDALTQEEFRKRLFALIQTPGAIETMGFQLTAQVSMVGFLEVIEGFIRETLKSHDFRFAGMLFKREVVNGRVYRNLQAQQRGQENDQILVQDRVVVRVNHKIIPGTTIPGKLDEDKNFIPSPDAGVVIEDAEE